MSWRRWWLPSVLVVMASLPGFLFTADPVARDQGVFATIGWQWLHGGVPYASAGLEHKGPLPFAAYALSQVLFGHSIESARRLAWLAMVVTAFLLVAIAARVWASAERRVVAATVVGVVYALVVGAGGLSTWWSGAQAESFMEPFVAGAVLLALGGHPLAAGAALGIATLGKPLALLLVPALLAGGVGAEPRRMVRFVVGLVVPWAVTAGYVAMNGAFGYMVDAVFLVNIDYARRGVATGFGHLEGFVGSHRTVVPSLLLVPALLGAAIAVGSKAAGGRALVAWLIGAYAAVFVQGRFFGYHYWPVVAPLALGVGAIVAAEWRGGVAAPWRRFLPLVAGALVLLSFAQLDWRHLGTRWQVRRGAMTRTELLRGLAPPGSGFDVQPADTERLAAWLRANTRPDEPVLVWGFEPAINFLAERRSPTRFLYDWFLTSRTVDPARQSRYWAIFWREIESSPPAVVIVVHGDTNPLERSDSAAQLAAIPKLADWLVGNYASEISIGDFEVYRRVP